MKNYTIYLFKSPRSIRGWLSYIEPSLKDRCTCIVRVTAENGPKAKNKAITAANRNFEGVEILSKNFTDEIWGINNFPELKSILSDVDFEREI